MFDYEIVINTQNEYKICPKCGQLYEAEYNFCSSHEEKTALVKVRFE